VSDVSARRGMREPEHPPARGLSPVGPTRRALPGPLAAARRRGSSLTGWSADAIVHAQRSVGNAVVARLVAVQRQEVPSTPPPEVSPEDRQKQLYAATATHDVPPLDATTKRNVEKSMSFAPIYDDIQAKAKLQQSVDQVNRELEDANNQLTIKTNNVQDVSGAPGSTAPGGGEPEKASAELERAKADVARLSSQAQTLADELKAKQEVVSKELTAIGVKDEAELVTFVEETFPNSFIERGAQIAIAALESNKTAAEKEQERYHTEHGATGDRKGLQDACRDLNNREKEIQAIQSTKTMDLPPGGADPADPAIQERAAIDEKVAPKQTDLDAKRAEYQLKYPILFKIDPVKVVEASEEQLDALINGPVQAILTNINDTENNIQDRSLKIWKLKGQGIDIPSLTKDDLGLKPGSTLDTVVDKKAAEDKTPAEEVAEALNALSLVADAVALLTGPVGMAIAAGVTAVAAVADVVADYKTMTATQAAGNVALDPQFKEMVADPSNADLGGLLFDLVKIGLSVLGVKAAIDAYKAAKIAAAGKAAAAEAIADLEKFKRSIKGANLDEAAKERLIAEAERQFAKQPKLLLQSAEQAKKELVALHTAGTDAAKVRIARIVDKYASDTYTKTFLELQESGRILALDEAGLRSLKVPPATLDGYLRKYVTGPNARAARGFVHPGPPRVIFIKPGSEADVSQTVVHELVHELQKSTGSAAGFVGERTFFYYQEHQAFLEQQRFLRQLRDSQGMDVIPETSRWLVDATPERITQEIRTAYKVEPRADTPVNEDELAEFVQAMLDRNEATRQKAILKKAEETVLK
jgi:hypothetical protein